MLIAGMALILCLVSVFFGMSIFNANNNEHIQHLNVADRIHYYDANLVPTLTYRAALSTIPFILGILITSVLVLRTTLVKKVKNLALGSLAAILVVIIFDVLTILNPYFFDFSKWGFVWITMGMIIIAANVLSIFINER